MPNYKSRDAYEKAKPSPAKIASIKAAIASLKQQRSRYEIAHSNACDEAKWSGNYDKANHIVQLMNKLDDQIDAYERELR